MVTGNIMLHFQESEELEIGEAFGKCTAVVKGRGGKVIMRIFSRGGVKAVCRTLTMWQKL